MDVEVVGRLLLFFNYGTEAPYLHYGVLDPNDELVHYVGIELPGPRLPHDMAITERYAILMDLPLIQDLRAASEGRHKIVFDRSTPARFGVIPRRGAGSEIRWFTASPCYIYHAVNAWEEGDEIVMDVCRVKRPAPPPEARTPLAKMLAYLRLDAQLWRYRFNLRTGATTEAPLDDANTEFPSIDARLVGQRSRYAYNVHISPESTLRFDGLVRYDGVTGEKQTHMFGPGRWGSEAPFAPRDGARAEGDGYLVTFIQDEAAGRSELAIFDASDVTRGPVGRVLLPQRVPLGFHGVWIRADQLRGAGGVRGASAGVQS